MAEKPKTQREMIDQLWYAVIGTNGEGLMARMERVENYVLHGRNGNGKKPKRLEVLTAVILGLTLLNATGWLDVLREAVLEWLRTGGPS